MGELDEAMCEAIALGERAGKQGDVPVAKVSRPAIEMLQTAGL